MLCYRARQSGREEGLSRIQGEIVGRLCFPIQLKEFREKSKVQKGVGQSPFCKTNHDKCSDSERVCVGLDWMI